LRRVLTQAEEAAYREKIAAIKRIREAEDCQRRAAAATKADAILCGSQAATDDHPYLVRKQVKAHGLRMSEGALVIPIESRGQICSLQFIDADGNKRFLAGGRIAGCYS
jgi:putative DNA primase/helicase